MLPRSHSEELESYSENGENPTPVGLRIPRIVSLEPGGRIGHYFKYLSKS